MIPTMRLYVDGLGVLWISESDAAPFIWRPVGKVNVYAAEPGLSRRMRLLTWARRLLS